MCIPAACNSLLADSDEQFRPFCVTSISQRLVLLRYRKISSPGCSANVFLRHSGLSQKNLRDSKVMATRCPRIGRSVMVLVYLLWTRWLLDPQYGHSPNGSELLAYNLYVSSTCSVCSRSMLLCEYNEDKSVLVPGKGWHCGKYILNLTPLGDLRISCNFICGKFKVTKNIRKNLIIN